MSPPTHLLLIAGRSGVGKTSVGYEIHHQLSQREVKHGYIEGDNLDQAFPRPWSDRLAERNLRAMWDSYRALGHTRLIYTNTVSVLVAPDLVDAIGGDVTVTSVLLTGSTWRPPSATPSARSGAAPDLRSDASVKDRLARREIGTALDLHVQRSRERAVELEARAPVEVTRIPTDGRAVPEIAGEIIDLVGWGEIIDLVGW